MRAVTLGKSRQLTIVFLAVLVPAAVTLVWLGLRLLEQDRILYGRREAERREAEVDSVVRSLSRVMFDVERRVLEGTPMAGAALLTGFFRGATVQPRSMAAWVTGESRLQKVPSIFDRAVSNESERHSTRQRDVLAAFARSPATGVRAGALIRLASLKEQRGDVAGAMEDYRELATIEDVQADGMPVDLLARRALCNLSSAGPVPDDLVQTLDADFLAGRWALPREAWEQVAADLSRCTKRPVTPTVEQLAVSAAVGWFVSLGDQRFTPSPYVSDITSDQATVILRGGRGRDRAMVIPHSTLEAWLTSAARETSLDPASLSLFGRNNESIVGARSRLGVALVRREPNATGLPWIVALVPGATPPVSADFQSRQRLFAIGLGALGLLLAGGAFLLWRVVQREMAVARLQAEFVAAVSHEFRTPVTSLRHVIELLQESDDLPADKRASFYGVLSRGVDRLHRLVESLLDFARMEEGRKPYNLQPLDPAVLVSEVVRDFQGDLASHGYEVTVTVDPESPKVIQADAASVGYALWNLLDNAVKYSPDRHAVSVSVGPHSSGMAIAVTDAGIGIPHDEHREIFQKFVRGGQASRLGIKGTGVGLAIVEHIALAHGGFIELESVPEQGSTFRLVLPIAP